MNERRINVSLRKSTRNALASIGSKDDSFDDLVRMLLLHYDDSINFENFK